MPCENLARGGSHLYPIAAFDLRFTGVACGKVFGQKTVVAEESSTLVVILLSYQSRATLTAAEAFVMPVALSIKNKVLHMYRQLTANTVLCHRIGLNIFTHFVLHTLLALQADVRQ